MLENNIIYEYYFDYFKKIGKVFIIHKGNRKVTMISNNHRIDTMRNKKNRIRLFNSSRIIIIITILLIAILGIGTFFAQYQGKTTAYYDCTVSSKGITYNHNNETNELRVQSSCGEFKIDSIPYYLINNNSKEIDNIIIVGETYNFETTGMRNSLLGMFPIIKKAEKI